MKSMYRGASARRGGQRRAPGVLRRAVHALEAWDDMYATYVDPRDAFWDDDAGELWQALGVGASTRTADQLVTSEEELKQLRDECRELARSNGFAINGHENRINYLIGSGHGYSVAPVTGAELSDEDQTTAQAFLNDWMKAVSWSQRQHEIVRRTDRDGECFLRLFRHADGFLRVRFVEPGQVSTPRERAQDPAASLGIQTDPADVETVLGYWIDGQLVEAAEIQHRKANVDFNVKRGLPLYFPVRRNLKRADKLLRNMSVVAEIQAAIALIRKHPSGTRAGLESYVSGKADESITNSATGTTAYYRRYAPGTILDAPASTEYEFPAQGIDATRFVQVLQAELRAISSRLVMPEFMLSSDASNANYSSTMVAEGPAVKQFQRLQWGMVEQDLRVIGAALDYGVETGGLSAELREKIVVDVTPPNLVSRDRNAEVTADIALVNARVMSVRTCQIKNDLDPDVEDQQIEDEAEKSLARNPFAGMEFGAGQKPDEESEEEDEEDGEGEPEDEEGKA